MAAFLSSLSIGLAIGAAALVVSSCALLAPLPKQKDVAERLAAFPTRGLPLEGRVMIHWSERQIPFIEADNDGDAAFALGLVHAHLRLGQMATMRMIARGRVAEMIGPLGVDIDHGLRTLSTPALRRRSSRAWTRPRGSGSSASWTASTITRRQRAICRTTSAFSAWSPNPGRSRTCSSWGASPART